MGVAGYNDTEVNRPPEAVSDWSVPAHFGGFCKWLNLCGPHLGAFPGPLLGAFRQLQKKVQCYFSTASVCGSFARHSAAFFG